MRLREAKPVTTINLEYIIEEFMTSCESYETLTELRDEWYDMAATYEEAAELIGYTIPEGFNE